MSGRATMWVGHATGRVLAVTAVLTAVLGVILASIGSIVAGVVCVIAAGIVAAFSRVTVMVDRRGLTVLYSRFHWPRTVIALEDVVSVEEVSLSPATWGGWGYRGSRKLAGRAAVLIRGGPGLRVELADGSKLSVSVDDPAEGVDVLRQLAQDRF